MAVAAEKAMAIVVFIGRAIPPLLGIALATVPLSAQEHPAELTGCYDVTVGEWYVLEYGNRGPEAPFAYQRRDSLDFELPSRIEFAGPHMRGNRTPPRTQIVVPEGALPSIHRIAFAEVTDDSLYLAFSTGHAGLRVSLNRLPNGWAGIASTFVDDSGERVDARSVTLIPARCDSPPPVGIDAMLPAPRSVELEDGAVIDLGKPLPESVETVPGPGGSARVVGRTTGLFATTDSIRVLLDRAPLDRVVVSSIRLIYPHDDYGTLVNRFRDVFGPREGVWYNRVTLVLLGVTESHGDVPVTIIELLDPRYWD